MSPVPKNPKKAFTLLVEGKPLLSNTFFPLQSFFGFEYVRPLNFCL